MTVCMRGGVSVGEFRVRDRLVVVFSFREASDSVRGVRT